MSGASPTSLTQEASKQTNTQIRTPPPSQPATTTTSADPAFPAVSLNDGGLSRRPRDGRVLHMILANMGVTAYQERVPQQLMDFAYRHTSSILQDALHFMSDVYNTSGTAAKQAAASSDHGAINLSALRLAVNSRTHYQFTPGLAKEQLQEMAHDRNKIALPPLTADGSLRLPPERYLFTGASFGLKDDWDSEGEENIEGNEDVGEQLMVDQEDKDGEEEDERMEDFFGETFDNEDQEMEG